MWWRQKCQQRYKITTLPPRVWTPTLSTLCSLLPRRPHPQLVRRLGNRCCGLPKVSHPRGCSSFKTSKVITLFIFHRPTNYCQYSTRLPPSTTRLPSPPPTGQTPPSPWPPQAVTDRPAPQSRRLDDNRQMLGIFSDIYSKEVCLWVPLVCLSSQQASQRWYKPLCNKTKQSYVPRQSQTTRIVIGAP